MRAEWNNVLMFCYIFLFMFIAKLLKEKIGLFKSIVFPTSLLAGFLGLIFGPELLGTIKVNIFNFEFPLGFNYSPDFYESFLFYFMIIAFVSLTLTERQNKQNATSFVSGMFIVSTYILQGLIGLSVIYIMGWTFWPEYFPGLGLILPLAFGQGPGLSSEVGKAWDQATNIGYIQQFGLTLSTVGFVVGGIIGVILLNYYIKKYNLKPVKLNQIDGVKTKQVSFSSLKEVNFFDNFLVQITWLALILFTTYLISSLIYNILNPIDHSIAGLIVGFSYLIGVFIAMGLRGFLRYLDKKGHRTNILIDDYIMQNIASFSLNVMITASVMSIRIASIKEYLPLLIIISVFGTIGTLIYVVFFGRYVFRKNSNHYILAMFGMLTGVASTGLALLRGVDPELETDTADNVVVLGSAIAAPIGLPIFILLGVQLKAYTENLKVNNIITYGVLLAYFALLVVVMSFIAKSRAKRNK